MDAKEIIRSGSCWFAGSLIVAFLFVIFGLKPLLRLLGWIFELMGGPGLEGTGL